MRIPSDSSANFHQIVRSRDERPWNKTEAPPNGAVVQVLASDVRGAYEIPFPVVFRDDNWRNLNTGQIISADVYVEGWRHWSNPAPRKPPIS